MPNTAKCYGSKSRGTERARIGKMLLFYISEESLFLMFLFIFETERDRAWAGEGQRGRETQNLKEAPGSEMSAQSLMRDLNSQTEIMTWAEVGHLTDWATQVLHISEESYVRRWCVCRNLTEVRWSHANILGKSVLSRGISEHQANAQPISGTKQACSRTSKKGRVAEVGHLTK